MKKVTKLILGPLLNRIAERQRAQGLLARALALGVERGALCHVLAQPVAPAKVTRPAAAEGFRALVDAVGVQPCQGISGRSARIKNGTFGTVKV